MYFVINSFIAAVCLATLILFTEVFPKIIKAIIALIGSGTCAYALAILVRKIAELTKWYAKPDSVLEVFYITLPIVLIIVILFAIILNIRRKKKANA